MTFWSNETLGSMRLIHELFNNYNGVTLLHFIKKEIFLYTFTYIFCTIKALLGG